MESEVALLWGQWKRSLMQPALLPTAPQDPRQGRRGRRETDVGARNQSRGWTGLGDLAEVWAMRSGAQGRGSREPSGEREPRRGLRGGTRGGGGARAQRCRPPPSPTRCPASAPPALWGRPCGDVPPAPSADTARETWPARGTGELNFSLILTNSN